MSTEGPLDPRVNLLRPDPAERIDCFLCGKPVEMSKAYACEEGTLPRLYCHGACANGKTPRQIARAYHKTCRQLFPPRFSPFEPMRLE